MKTLALTAAVLFLLAAFLGPCDGTCNGLDNGTLGAPDGTVGSTPP